MGVRHVALYSRQLTYTRYTNRGPQVTKKVRCLNFRCGMHVCYCTGGSERLWGIGRPTGTVRGARWRWSGVLGPVRTVG